MKKQFAIFIDIDTERDDGTTSRMIPIKEDIFGVILNADVIQTPKNDGIQSAVLPVLTHEIGHALHDALFPIDREKSQHAKMIQTIGPELSTLLGYEPINAPKVIYKDEEKAWAVGQQIFNSVKEWALSTYKGDSGNAR